jgi:serine/threonine-protein kinase
MATDSSMTGHLAPLGMTLIERLGAGSVFEVARVRDERGRELILKRIVPHARSAGAAGALEREQLVLRTTTALRVRCLPELVAAGTDELGGYVVETFAPGSPARTFARNAPPYLSPSEWSAMARASCTALAELHAMRDSAGGLDIVHGDISPDNLFIQADTATFIDLSNSTFRDAPTPAFARSRGTLPYAAPEVARNEAAPTQASDTYALAATLLFLAIGAITDTQTEASRLLEVGTRGVRLDKLDLRSDLPERARTALAGALRFESRNRIASASELARELSA